MLPVSSSSGICPSSSQAFAGDPTCSFSPPVDFKRIGLEECIDRIKSAIKQVKLEIPNENIYLKKIICSITLDVPKDPVVTNCGHIYERAAIQQWKDKNGVCPECSTPISEVFPIYALRDLIDSCQQEDPIPTCSNFKRENPRRAATYLATAQGFIKDKDYREALRVYIQAFQYTKSSADYAAIPGLYDKLREPKKSTLSRLYLSLYQIQEGKLEEAAKTLGRCRSDALNVNLLTLALRLQSHPSLDYILLAKISASNQNNQEDSVFIDKQILDAYSLLSSKAEDLKEKRKLLFKAADLAQRMELFDLQTSFRAAAAGIPVLWKDL